MAKALAKLFVFFLQLNLLFARLVGPLISYIFRLAEEETISFLSSLAWCVELRKGVHTCIH